MIKGTLNITNSVMAEPETQISHTNKKNTILRSKHRKNHFISSSLHDLVDTLLVSLRLYDEIRDNKISLPIDLPTKEQALDDFQYLQDSISMPDNDKNNQITLFQIRKHTFAFLL